MPRRLRSPVIIRAQAVLLGLALLTGVAAVPTAAQAGGTGELIVPSLLGARDRAAHPGFVPPLVWVYDEVGKLLPSRKAQGAYDVGEKIELPEGWYKVELGNVHAERNRVKLFVKSGRVTVVPTGLIVVNVEPPEQQPRDVCNRWTSALTVRLPIDPAPGPVIATNRGAANHSTGIVQVVAGYYRILWNGFTVAADVKPSQALNLPTGLVGPMPASDYMLHAAKGSRAGNPGVRLCRNRGTRVLSRTYWGTYNQQITAFPFKQRMWEQITVEPPESREGPYQRVRVQSIRGRVYRGPGSEPVAEWENEPPADEAPTPPEEDSGTEQQGEAPSTDGPDPATGGTDPVNDGTQNQLIPTPSP